MSAVEFTLRSVAALLMVAATFVAAYRGAWALVGVQPTVLRWAAVPVIGCWLATVGFHVVRPLGLFVPSMGVVGALALGALSLKLMDGVPTRTLLARDARALRCVGRSIWRRRWLRAAALLFAPLVLARVARGLILPPLGWDAMAYRGVRAALFVQSGAFSLLPAPGAWTMQRHYYAGSELLWAWTMLPFHGDLLASFANGLQWVAVGLGAWALARVLGLRGLRAAAAGVFALFIPPLQLLAPSGYSELALVMAATVSVTAAVVALRTGRPGLVLLALVAGGVAAGIKQTGAVPGLIVAACLLAAAFRRARFGRAARLALGVGLIAAALPALPWLIAAWIETGAPLSPIPLEILGITLGIADPQMGWYLDREVPQAFTLQGELGVLRAMLGLRGALNEGLGFTSLAFLALCPLGLVRWRRREPWVAALLLAVMVGTLGLLYAPGMTTPRHYSGVNVTRYVTGALLIAVPLGLWGLARWRAAANALALLAILAAALHGVSLVSFGWAPFEPPLIAGAAAAGIALIALCVWATRQRSWVLGAVAVSLLLVGLETLRHVRQETRWAAARDSIQFHAAPRYWVEGARAVDRPGQPLNIAVTSGPTQRASTWFVYYFLGSELQNTLDYVPITTNGRIAHFSPDDGRRRLADRSAWLDRLRERGIDYIVALGPPSVELQWMREDRARFEPLAGGARWGLFRLRR